MNINTAAIVRMNTISYISKIVLGINCSFSCCNVYSTSFYSNTGTIVITTVMLTDNELTGCDFGCADI